MFIVKFTSSNLGCNATPWSVEDVHCCNHYYVYHHSNGTKSVTIYPTASADNGITFEVMSDVEFHCCENISVTSSYYHRCYIENMNGKTINNISTEHQSMELAKSIACYHDPRNPAVQDIRQDVWGIVQRIVHESAMQERIFKQVLTEIEAKFDFKFDPQ